MVSEQSRHTSDLYVRTSWIDARLALSQIDKGKAEGHRTPLWLRAKLQDQLFQLGCFLHHHSGKVLFVALLVLCSFCVGLKSAVIHSRVEQLWVQEGGRLEAEIKYTQSILGDTEGSTHQLMIQTPKEPGASLLHPGALLAHLDVIKEATAVTFTLFDINWRLKDICRSPGIPSFDIQYIDEIFDSMIPCAIITPLDCFWEGSKLLGPDFPVNIPSTTSKIKWTNLHPQKMMVTMNVTYGPTAFAFSTLEQHMKRAGITSGYQEKPCLDPRDSECPRSAPNKATGHLPDIGAVLTGGCYGFATKHMHWPEDAIVGGAKKNKNGVIQRASALQTVVQLMGAKEMFDFWSDTYKVHHVDWTQEKAALVLDTWQKKFSEEVKRLMRGKGHQTPTSSFLKNYNMYPFSTATLNDILRKFSEPNFLKVGITYLCMLIYAVVTLVRWQDCIRSQCAVGIAGTFLVAVTVVAGLGLCAVLGIAFNAITTQIVPFIALGLGVDSMFLLTHLYAVQNSNEYHFDEQIGTLLKKAGVGILLSSLSKVLTFLAASLVPLPGLRAFCFQGAILSLFNLGAMLLVFPAIMSIDLKRRRAKLKDLLCCCLPAPTTAPRNRHLKSQRKLQAVTRALPPDRQQTVTSILTPPARIKNNGWGGSSHESDEPKSMLDALLEEPCGCGSMASWYSSCLIKPPVKFTAMVCLIAVLGTSVWGLTELKDGLELTDIVPNGSVEHSFLAAQGQYFGFYNMYAVTSGDFDYPNNQQMLYEYHETFMRVQSIIKNDNGGLPEFWLGHFRDWLSELQKAFDRDWANGFITQEWWFKNNASVEAILAYKLLVQTGHVDNPIDKSLVTQVRLVDDNGIINPKAFYNYLSAWASNDALTYGASEANLHPEPKEWFHVPTDVELKIPKSAPLTYTQLPFYLHGLTDTNKITKLIRQVRELCEQFEARGLPNFPSGIPFLFWEPYSMLREKLCTALGYALIAVFVLVSFFLVNMHSALVVTLSAALIIVQVLGLMGAIGIELSAIPCVLLIASVGVAVHFSVHLTVSFLTSIGSQDHRVMMAVDYMLKPITQGGLAILLAVGVLAFSEFEFIVRHVFYIIVALVSIGLVNGLFFLPVLLSLFGPAAEVVPLFYPDRISTPTPEPVRRVHAPKCRIAPPPRRHTQPHQYQRESSLTTITEEGSWNSQISDPAQLDSAESSWHSQTREQAEPSWHSQTREQSEPSWHSQTREQSEPSWHSQSREQSEPSWHSQTREQSEPTQRIVVEPEFVVETTTFTHPHMPSSGSDSSCSSHRDSQQSMSQPHVTTKVTATAKVKVEVHTPLSGSVDKTRHSRRYRDSSSDGTTISTRYS